MTWSLFKAKEDDLTGVSLSKPSGLDVFDSNINEKSRGDELKPLVFSNGKTQEDIVREVLDAIKSGEKIIFIRGVCGSGKSAIALNLARHFKKTSIVVPIKSLQKQYEEDYTRKNFILKEDGKKLKIAVIKGRNNFNCQFLGGSADAKDLPCDIELREKNMGKITEYIEQNPFVDKKDFSVVSDVRRFSVAPACPYWCPLLPSNITSKVLEQVKKKKYMAVNGKEYALFQRKKGCGYYDQYQSYIDSDVLIFNSLKYLIEMAIGRKPRTDLDVIDECDDFLDSFAEERKINLNRLVNALSNIFPDNSKDIDAVKDLIHLSNNVLKEASFEIQKVEGDVMLKLIEKVIENPYLAEGEDGNYYNSVFEICKAFENLVPETYVSYDIAESKDRVLFGKPERTVYASLVSINLAQRFKEITEKNNVLVLMSGTVHSEQVLKDIFGLENFKIIEAETKQPGVISKIRTGLEKNCKYQNFKSGQVSREDYLRALSTCVANAKPPTLVHVSSFGDLPSEQEKVDFDLSNIPSKEEVLRLQSSAGKHVSDFKKKEVDILFTTKCSRGVDFPGEQCNSVVLTKYPYPNIQGLFWKILRKEQPEKYLEFYLDKAKRELIQKISRGLRFPGDFIMLLSPDSRVLDARF